MNRLAPSRNRIAHQPAWQFALTAVLLVCTAAQIDAQAANSDAQAQSPDSVHPLVLDQVVAVVNRHAILLSDVEDEVRLSILDAGRGAQGQVTEQRALEQLISRALIEQQIRQEDLRAIEPSQEEVNARVEEIRRQLPACMRQNCASDAGWKAFLVAHSLTAGRVDAYIRYRLEILRFIEERFRQGIEISQQQIADYYHNTLVPQYAPGETVPSLATVAPRIQEILLQQQVNALFDNWLNNLREQGDVEVLDPKLATTLEDPAAPGNSRKRRPVSERELIPVSSEVPNPPGPPPRPVPSRLRRFFLRHLPLSLAGAFILLVLASLGPMLSPVRLDLRIWFENASSQRLRILPAARFRLLRFTGAFFISKLKRTGSSFTVPKIRTKHPTPGSQVSGRR